MWYSLEKEYRNITKSHGNYFLTLLICVHRPIECFFEPFMMYFIIFYVNVVLLNLRGSQKITFLNKIPENLTT